MWGHGGEPLLMPQSQTLLEATASPVSQPAWAGREVKRSSRITAQGWGAQQERMPGPGELP